MKTEEITLRSIQHFMYCPHRWGLMEIDKAWLENIFVTKANLLHERVHDPERNYTARGKKVYTSVPVYNDLDQYNLYGVTDCLELTSDPRGVTVYGSDETYKICIVEYKPTKPVEKDYRDDDLMQVFAQKICVDYVFGGDCDCCIYYANVKRRISLPIREHFSEYDEILKELLLTMRRNLESGTIPPVRKGQNCGGCSMRDLCMPFIKSPGSLRNEMLKLEKRSS